MNTTLCYVVSWLTSTNSFVVPGDPYVVEEYKLWLMGRLTTKFVLRAIPATEKVYKKHTFVIASDCKQAHTRMTIWLNHHQAREFDFVQWSHCRPRCSICQTTITPSVQPACLSKAWSSRNWKTLFKFRILGFSCFLNKILSIFMLITVFPYCSYILTLGFRIFENISFDKKGFLFLFFQNGWQ